MNLAAETTNELKKLNDEIKRGSRVISLSGLTSIASKAFILSKLQSETRKTFVIITDSNKELENWECDLDFWQKSLESEVLSLKSKNKDSRLKTQDSRLLSLPSMESDIYAGVSPHAETLEKRALSLWNLIFQKPDFLILPAKSLITKTAAPEKLKNFGANLKLDEDFPPEKLVENLAACGYRREDPIANVGEFSMRGGIVDVWSPDSELPFRIEFFGDTVDSIRTFDAETQLSINQLKTASIAPMREFSASSDDFKIWAEYAVEHFTDEKFARNLKDRTDFAKEGEDFSGWEFLLPLVNPSEASVFDYLPQNCVFVIDEPAVIEQTLENFYERLKKHYEVITDQGEIGLEPDRLFLNGKTLREKIEKAQRLELRSLGKTAAQTDEQFQNI